MLKQRGNKGITLISLVITIIVLLILAGIVISLTIGENGIISKAQIAGEDTRKAAAREKVELALLDLQGSKLGQAKLIDVNEFDNKQSENYQKDINVVKEIQEGDKTAQVTTDGYVFTIDENLKIIAIDGQVIAGLPENTTENPVDMGKEVQLSAGWATETMRYISTNDGKEVAGTTKVATVYAISVGDGVSIPVPYGFWYVGGNLDTGVIISDNEADKYDGTTDKTTWEYTTQLKGNQFVWIPCKLEDYKKSNVWNGTTQTNAVLASAWWDTTTHDGEIIGIQKYGGFYVGRYEAGLAETIDEFTQTQQHTESNQIYNVGGIPQSKAGQIPWMFIDWTTAKANAQSMYHTDCVSSGLITGTQWDVMLNTMLNKGAVTANELTNSGSWGNYRDTQIPYKGRLAKAYYSSGTAYLPVFGEEATGITSSYSLGSTYGDLLTTGASSTTQRYHLFDVAGNLWEWTEENSRYGGNVSTQYRMFRGSSYIYASSNSPACYRIGEYNISHTNLNVGFRTVLYMK